MQFEKDSYITILDIGNGEFTEKKSKFIAFSFPIHTEEEAKDIITQFKQKYYDARHVCYAYVIGFDQQKKEKSNDDGEPSGTAGIPILNQILKRKLTNTLVVVIRYFGGILLGAANLGRAYKNAAELSLESASFQKVLLKRKVSICSNYNCINIVERIAKKYDLEIIDRIYLDDTVTFILEIRLSIVETLPQLFTDYPDIIIQNDNS